MSLSAKVRADKRRLMLKRRGQWVPPYVDATPAREHIVHLRDTYGLSLEAVALLAGQATETVVQIVYPGHHQHRPTIRRETSAAILAARFDLTQLGPRHRVAVVGTQRRLWALSRIGYSRTYVADRLGMTRSNLSRYLWVGRKWVSVDKALAVRALYDELSMTQGPSSKAIGWAKRQGWPPPLAWDDDSIDAIGAASMEGARPAIRSALDTCDELADLLDVVDPDITAEHAARRLGYAEASNLYTTLERAGRLDLRARLDRNAEPPPIVTRADLFPSARRNRKENAA